MSRTIGDAMQLGKEAEWPGGNREEKERSKFTTEYNLKLHKVRPTQRST